jgi:hypothetical protein
MATGNNKWNLRKYIQSEDQNAALQLILVGLFSQVSLLPLVLWSKLQFHRVWFCAGPENARTSSKILGWIT